MIVLKFGGTSVEDAAAFERALTIISNARAQQPLVVVSALAKTTALLTQMGRDAAQGRLDEAQRVLTLVMARHRELADQLALGESAGPVQEQISRFEAQMLRLLVGIDVLQECTPKTCDHLATFGERMSSMLLVEAARARGLDSVLLDAFHIMITDAQFGRARPDLDLLGQRARSEIIPHLEAGRVPVIQGYIGATPEGVPTTMGFEASDFTATLLGAALDADEIQIWTDVPGMLSADNRVAADAQTLSRLSFLEAEELAHLGASVIHPDAVRPAARKDIPVRILNSRDPGSGNTLLSHAGDPDLHGVRSIALLRGISRVRLAPLLHAPPREGFGRWALDVLARHGVTVELISASERGVALAVQPEHLSDDLCSELETEAVVSRVDGLCLVSVAGADLEDAPDVASLTLASLSGIPLSMISQGPSPRSLSVMVSEVDAERAVRKLHEVFIAGARSRPPRVKEALP